MTKAEAIRRFRRAFLRKYGKSARFEHRERDRSDPQFPEPERIDVSVRLTRKIDWSDVEPAVEAMLKRTGASRYFEIGGAGLGFGYRDVSVYRRGG